MVAWPEMMRGGTKCGGGEIDNSVSEAVGVVFGRGGIPQNRNIYPSRGGVVDEKMG